MCTVLRYQYACGHHVARRSSRCHGTRSKPTRTTEKAACAALPYITIQQISRCTKCLRDSWLEAWNARLAAARAFSEDIARDSPGKKEIRRMVEELEERFEAEAWVLKKEIPDVEKARVGRVEVGKWVERRGSKLRFEVMREDVLVGGEEGEGEGEGIWGDNGGEDENDGWEPYADPMHPISTTYDPLVPGLDDQLMAELLTVNDWQEECPDHMGGDPFAAQWEQGWEHESPEKLGEDDGFLSFSNTDIQSPAHAEQIDALVKTFEKITLPPITLAASEPSLQSTPDTLVASGSQGEHIQNGYPRDGYDSRLNGMIMSNTQLKYAAVRRKLEPLRHTDPRKYYKKWLVECRSEIREILGVEARIWNPR